MPCWWQHELVCVQFGLHLIPRSIQSVQVPLRLSLLKLLQFTLPVLGRHVYALDPYLAQAPYSVGRPQLQAPLPQVTPIFGMYFLQAELTINECSRRRKWTERGAENIA